MEATAFICLTDVILPVRQVVKDGVSTLEQGSDAYLDWVCPLISSPHLLAILCCRFVIWPDKLTAVLTSCVNYLPFCSDE
jgi:hypothetical protein